MAFSASIKTSALNWPHSRGTATGFPLAAFGLSAFFFSMFAQFVTPGDIGHFLMLLASGTFGITFVGFFFLRVIPHPHYSALSSDLTRTSSNRLHRTKSEDSRHRPQDEDLEPGTHGFVIEHLPSTHALNRCDLGGAPIEGIVPETDETSSLMSKSTSNSGDLLDEPVIKDHAHRVDIRGFKMLSMLEFWQLFALMGLLAGIGLMSIK